MKVVFNRYALIVALLCVLLGTALVFLFLYAIPRLHVEAIGTTAAEGFASPVRAQSAVVAPPQLDFYTELSKVPVTSVVDKRDTASRDVDLPAVMKRGHYVLQLAAFEQTDDAHVFSDRLALLGYQAFVMKWVQSHKTLYRVCVGPYASKEAAFPDQLKLKKFHIDSYVRQLSSSMG